MKTRIEFIKIDEDGKTIMTNIKKKTGIGNWNVLCRYALLLSVINGSIIDQLDKQQKNSIVMEWKTFSGKYASILEAIIKFKYSKELQNKSENFQESYEKYISAHINRGLKKMKKIENIKDMIELIKKYKSHT